MTTKTQIVGVTPRRPSVPLSVFIKDILDRLGLHSHVIFWLAMVVLCIVYAHNLLSFFLFILLLFFRPIICILASPSSKGCCSGHDPEESMHILQVYVNLTVLVKHVYLLGRIMTSMIPYIQTLSYKNIRDPKKPVY